MSHALDKASAKAGEESDLKPERIDDSKPAMTACKKVVRRNLVAGAYQAPVPGVATSGYKDARLIFQAFDARRGNIGLNFMELIANRSG